MSTVRILSAISRTICSSKRSRCASQKHRRLRCYCSGDVVWSNERLLPTSFFLDVRRRPGWLRSRVCHLGRLCSFSSSCPCNPSVLMMRSKARGFSRWRRGPACLPWGAPQAAAAVTYDEVQRSSRGSTKLNLWDPVSHFYLKTSGFIKLRELFMRELIIHRWDCT